MNGSVESGKDRLKKIAESIPAGARLAPPDYERMKSVWLEKLNELYGNIKNWLGGISNISIEEAPISIHEEYIGNYEATKLIIYIGTSSVVLIPRGTIIIAAEGRIDVQSSNGKQSMIVLVRKGQRPRFEVRMTVGDEEAPALPMRENSSSTEEYEWLIVGERIGKDFTVLIEETFSTLIADLIE